MCYSQYTSLPRNAGFLHVSDKIHVLENSFWMKYILSRIVFWHYQNYRTMGQTGRYRWQFECIGVKQRSIFDETYSWSGFVLRRKWVGRWGKCKRQLISFIQVSYWMTSLPSLQTPQLWTIMTIVCRQEYLYCLNVAHCKRPWTVNLCLVLRFVLICPKLATAQ